MKELKTLINLPLPKVKLYIMLNLKNSLKHYKFKNVTFLILISIFTFHTEVLGANKKSIADEYRKRGFAEQQRSNFVSALQYYNKAISLGEEDPVFLNDIGILYEEMELVKKAESYYLRAIQLDQKYLPAYLNLAYLYLQNGNEGRAIKYFKLRYTLAEKDDPWAKVAKKELIKINPSFIEWFALKEVKSLNDQIVQRKHDELVENVKSSKIYVERGDMWVKKGEYEKAILEYNRALYLTPKAPSILKAREKAVLAQAKENVRKHSDLAIKMLNSGDSFSAKREVQKLLTTIPNKPVAISR